METPTWIPIYLVCLKKRSPDGSIRFIQLSEDTSEHSGQFANRPQAIEAYNLLVSRGSFKAYELEIRRFYVQSHPNT